MTMKWSFSYNSFVKFHGKKWEPQHDCVSNQDKLISFIFKTAMRLVQIPCSPFIMQCLRSIEMDRVISQSRHNFIKETILQKNYRKMTMTICKIPW